MKWILLFIPMFFSCAQRIKVPINRMDSPEAIGGGFDLEYKQMGYSQGLLDFSDSSTTNPLEMRSVTNRELYLGGGVSQNVDLFVKVPEESASLLGIKVQVLGTPNKAKAVGHQLAFTLAMGAARDTFDGDYEIMLKSDVTDYSLIHGYRFNEYAMIYEGISLSNFSFEGKIEDDNTGLDSDEFLYDATNILGVHAGAVFGTTNFKFKLEIAAQKVKWSNTPDKTLYSGGYSLTATF